MPKQRPVADEKNPTSTAGLCELGWSTADFRKVTNMTDIGLHAKMDADLDADTVAIMNRFFGTYISWRMIGKLAIPRTEAAVRENDGTNGMPLYKTYGKEVYDLTRESIPTHSATRSQSINGLKLLMEDTFQLSLGGND